jgi:carbon-monoxide dehydrogenase medium subunit
VGATATLREVENHPAVMQHFPALARGAKEVGSVQIRNLATLAGNVCNASPSGDTLPALLAYDATVELAGGMASTRLVAVADFWRGPGITTLQPGEMAVSVRLPPAALRASLVLPQAGGPEGDGPRDGRRCLTLVPGEGGPQNVRIALGAVAPSPSARVRRKPRGAGRRRAIEEAAVLAASAASPIDDQRASAAYRAEMVRVLTARALRQLLSQMRCSHAHLKFRPHLAARAAEGNPMKQLMSLRVNGQVYPVEVEPASAFST